MATIATAIVAPMRKHVYKLTAEHMQAEPPFWQGFLMLRRAWVIWAIISLPASARLTSNRSTKIARYAD